MSDANDHEEMDGLAAEYVLGTLSASERLAAEARLRSDRPFRAAVDAWAERLQPLADAMPPVASHAELFHRITARIAAPAAMVDVRTVASLRATVGRWRVTAGLAAMVAAAAIVVAIGDRMVPSVAPHQFVAVLSTAGSAPAFVATVNLDAQTLVIRRVTDAAPADKSYQLWAVPTGGAPQSLGVIEQARYSHDLPLEPANLTLAVSLEPKGGSTTGAPTGPIVFTGQLIAGN